MMNILLIDHSTDRQIHLKNILKAAGYSVAITEDLETALSLAEQLHPHLVICPSYINQIDGLEICQKLKFKFPSTPPFFITITSTVEEWQSICQNYPEVDDGLISPIQPEELLSHVRLGLKIYQLNQRVQQAQNQRVKNEKLLSLGQMVSGIAHEINNPVALITGNISHASEYTQDLLEILQLYTEKYPEPDAELQDLIEELDLELLMEDFPKVLTAMKTGADRIRQLVQSLRNFYHADDSEQKFINIHRGIDDILLILKGRLKGKQGQPIEVVKDYGELPSIECYPGQLNQVIMNLLNNGIDALDLLRDQNGKFEPKIWIKTEPLLTESQVRIRIKDNGIGIPEGVQAKIFDPFFTTKSSDQGAGFGLSMSQTIITQNHGGNIKCCSEKGTGSEFIIEIPITQLH